MKKHKKLYVVRSLTKLFALPGIRMGYVLSSPENIEGIIRQLPEWNLPVTAEAAICAGMKLLKETDLVRDSVEEIRKERNYLSEELKRLGIRVCESDTCFILCRGPEGLYGKLLKKGVMIRDCSDERGLGKTYFRIAVSKHRTNESFIKILEDVMHENRNCEAG